LLPPRGGFVFFEVNLIYKYIIKYHKLGMQIFKVYSEIKTLLPLFSSKVPAGFPSPADDYLDRKIDLNQHLIHYPEATFLVKVEGDSMIGAGIFSGDTLIVDKSLEPRPGQIILAVLNGEFTVKKYTIVAGKTILEPENPEYLAIEITKDSDFQIWGVVTFVIHKTSF
jgi:DNA polymerase V